MFCPSCGFEYTQKTNYCKRCGSGLGSSDKTPAPQMPGLKITGVFFVIAAFALFSLIYVFEFYEDMLNRGRGRDEAMIPFVFGIALIGAVVGLLSWQLSRMITTVRRHTEQDRPMFPAIPTFPTSADVQPQIAAPKDQIPNVIERPSVSEHTTRQMAGRYRGPNADA